MSSHYGNNLVLGAIAYIKIPCEHIFPSKVSLQTFVFCAGVCVCPYGPMFVSLCPYARVCVCVCMRVYVCVSWLCDVAACCVYSFMCNECL